MIWSVWSQEHWLPRSVSAVPKGLVIRRVQSFWLTYCLVVLTLAQGYLWVTKLMTLRISETRFCFVRVWRKLSTANTSHSCLPRFPSRTINTYCTSGVREVENNPFTTAPVQRSARLTENRWILAWASTCTTRSNARCRTKLTVHSRNGGKLTGSQTCL